ncbi:MAG: arginine--tRNA ligase [Ardenticatenia bacterium]|nr:MAG: arginine--tRNA ligase [Ardenticatenia bacterium]
MRLIHLQLRDILADALQAAMQSGALPEVAPEALPEIIVERPKRAEHGDFASPMALPLARPMRRAPRQIAEVIVAHLPDNELIASVELAGPGYINIRLNPGWLTKQVDRILQEGEAFADLDIGAGKTAQVEFVSANPTGPLTVGHGRGAVLGDTLASILQAVGWNVTREYYYNDAGRQMRVLGDSVRLRLLQLLGQEVEFPEDYYQGEYIIDIARDILNEYGPEAAEKDWQFFKQIAQDVIFADIRQTLERLNIHHDVYTNEATFYETGAIWDVLERLREKGYVYDKDGAVWFKATEFGADKDRVLVRSTGEPTYRLPDIAYHVNKLERGFDLIVDVLGADHIAEMPDVINAVYALGYTDAPQRIQPIFHQFVTLVRGGQAVKMSTRRANFVTLDELIDEVGPDAVRYFMISRSPNAQMEFDLELATQQSDENPVYYIQYAHARTAGILERQAPERGISFDPNADVSVLTHPSELALIREMLRLSDVLAHCAAELAPHHLTFYARELASTFNQFYRDCPVLTAEDEALVKARLKLVKAAQIALARTLHLLGMQAPSEM